MHLRLGISAQAIPQEHGQNDGGLHERELVPHALARAAAEWDEGKIRGHLIGVQRGALGLRPVARPSAVKSRVAVGLGKALGPELVRVTPQMRRPADMGAPVTSCKGVSRAVMQSIFKQAASQTCVVPEMARA